MHKIYKHAASKVYTFLHIPLGSILKKPRQNASAARWSANQVFSAGLGKYFRDWNKILRHDDLASLNTTPSQRAVTSEK